MEIVTLLLGLLPLKMCSEYQEMELIKELTDYFDFDHHFFLLDSTADTNRYLNTKGRTPQSLFVFESVDNFTELANVGEMSSKNVFLVVAPETTQLDQNSTFLRQIKRLQRLQINMKIGVFFLQQASMEDLYKFFAWCKDNLIIDIFAASYPCSDQGSQSSCPKCSNNIFTFQPFGKFEVLNVTGSGTYDGFFPSQSSNFLQHQLRLGTTLYNHHEKIWRNVFRLMNATFVNVKRNFTSISDDHKYGVDLYPLILSQEKPHELGVYPSEISVYGIFVPEALPYSEFSAYLRNATSGAIFCYSFVAIVALVLILIIPRYFEQEKISFFQTTADVFNLLMNDNGNIKYQRLSRSEIFVIVPLTFVGLIFTNGILSTFQSHVTRPLLQPQLKTLEDIYSSSLSIALFDDDWQTAVISELSKRKVGNDWSRKVVSYEKEYQNYWQTYNLTMAYFGSADFAKVMLRIQKRLKIKGYYNPHIQIGSYFFGYQVNPKFLYFERLNDILHRIKSAGLYQLWLRQYFAGLENNILKDNVKRLAIQKESYVESYEFPSFLYYGWLAGLIVFIIEKIWKRYNFSAKILREVVDMCVSQSKKKQSSQQVEIMDQHFVIPERKSKK